MEELQDECSKASSLFDKSEPTEPRNRKFIIFQETKPTSVYSYSIVAGQFKYQERHNYDMPRVRIYAREKLLPFVNYEELLDVLEAGIKFYEDFFSTPYPYGKYEIAFVPEYNYGAMNNVGCLTEGGTIEGNELDYVHSNASPATTMTYNEAFIF